MLKQNFKFFFKWRFIVVHCMSFEFPEAENSFLRITVRLVWKTLTVSQERLKKVQAKNELAASCRARYM